MLGCFVSIFAYCLFVLRTIRGGDEGRFIPPIAVTGGLVLALLSIGVLIFFIHHMASSIQASNIVLEAAQETEASIKRLFPQKMGAKAELGKEAELMHQMDELRWVPVPAQGSGYVQDLDNKALLAMARELGGVVRMAHGIGSFVARGATLASVARYDSPLPCPWPPR
ncbi:MAG: DUF2254 family protein [Hymenobacter sp.]